MITKNFKAIVSLSKKQYSRLVLQGYLDIKGQKLIYSPDDTLYVTNDIEYVRYDTDKQKLTEIEKQNARTNINAISQNDIKLYLHNITINASDTSGVAYYVYINLTTTSSKALTMTDLVKIYKNQIINASFRTAKSITSVVAQCASISNESEITIFFTTVSKTYDVSAMTDSVVEL